jgi:hypothetical protein
MSDAFEKSIGIAMLRYKILSHTHFVTHFKISFSLKTEKVRGNV